MHATTPSHHSRRINFVSPALICLLLAVVVRDSLSAADIAAPVTHVKVFSQKGRFGGWPATHGIWAWGNEILVGFTSGVYEDRGERHHIATDQPVRHMQARSKDGGMTWRIEDPNSKRQLLPEGHGLHGQELPGVPLPPWQASPTDIRFAHPDFAMALKLNDIHTGPSRFYLSYNRGHDWSGPYRVPAINGLEIAARTDYLINSDASCFLFLTAAKADHREGRPFVAHLDKHGKDWKFHSWINESPQGFSIMPASLRLSETELFTVVRHRSERGRMLRAYRSKDNGRSWIREADPVEDLGAGNPPSLVQLPSGELCIAYGVRAKPYRICVKLSRDHGHTWGSEIVLRDDGSSTDIGYPRAVVRPDGKVVVVYYFSDAVTGPERYIAATLWTPPAR